MPADLVGNRAFKMIPDRHDVGIGGGVDVRDDREARHDDRGIANETRECRAGRFHERRVPSAGDVERHDALGARGERRVAGGADRGRIAADHDLTRSIEVRQLHAAPTGGDRRGGNLAQRLRLEAQNGGHGAGGLVGGAVHGQPTFVHQRQGPLERQRAGNLEAAKLAERMACGNDGIEHVADGCPNRDVGDENCRLGVARLAQGRLRTVGAHGVQVVTDDVLGDAKTFGRRRVRLGDLRAHPDDLRALPGKNDPDPHAYARPLNGGTPLQRQAIAPHESPAPNATNIMTSPSFIRAFS